jgi:hypothetical protein
MSPRPGKSDVDATSSLSLSPPTLRESGHCILAGRCIAVGRRNTDWMVISMILVASLAVAPLLTRRFPKLAIHSFLATRYGFLRLVGKIYIAHCCARQPSNQTTTEITLRDVQEAARHLGLQIQVFNASISREIDAAFGSFAREGIDAVFIGPDIFFIGRRTQFITLAARHAVPATFPSRDFPEGGGLMSYGADIASAWHQVGVYAGRILKGAKPMDLPVVQASKFELVIIGSESGRKCRSQSTLTC